MLVIPAIDIIDGKIVRLKKGDYKSPVFYDSDLLNLVKNYKSNGFELIHIVDLNASRDGKMSLFKLLEELIKKTEIRIQFGGGIREISQIENLLNIGVQRIILGSLTVHNKLLFEEMTRNYALQSLVVSIDVLNENVMVKGWTENSNINIYDHFKYGIDLGIRNFLCTDINKDGMLQGSSISLYENILRKFPDINLIASGGVASISDLEQLQSIGIPEVVVGKALYENRIKLEELKRFASKENNTMS